MVLSKICADLADQGYSINPNFLSLPLSTALREDSLSHPFDFSKALIRKNSDFKSHALMRTDSTLWWNQTSLSAIQNQLWLKIEALRMAMNKTLFLGLDHFEGHYAIYNDGGYYDKHYDSFHSKNDRKVSFVIYLNHHWSSAEGGMLRIFVDSKPIDIAPLSGTLVCFMSEEIEHEVLRCFSARYSFVGWYKILL